MEAQQLPTPSTVAPPQSTVAPPPSHPSHLNYPDSVDSSPRSRNTDSWDEPFPPASAKLRLMCSYGGHIVPRPHDKSLCYVGGDTRIVVVERNTSLADLSTRLSRTFLDGRSFTLKYQLPNEDLDSLISVTTDEDLDNMIDEYDRTNSNSSIKPSRIRLFLFPIKPDSSQSIPPILDSSVKSDDWFLNALNSAGLLNRGFSDSASVDSLLRLDDAVVGNNLEGSKEGGVAVEGSILQTGSFANSKNLNSNSKQDVHSVPDSPMLENSSSFGSTSSSPSLANLPPIRVHVEDGNGGGKVKVLQHDQKVMGIEEQFAQMGVGVGQKQEEGFAVMSSPPPPPVPTTLSAAAVSAPIGSAAVPGDYPNRVISDDQRSDQGVPVGYRKPPTSQQQTQTQVLLPSQFQQKSTGAVDLPSPDSVSSDSSFQNAMSRQKPVNYQEQVQTPSGTRVLSSPVDPKLNVSDPHGAMPISAYYPVYPSQQQSHPHPQVYYMPARQPQAYNLSMQQANIGESATAIQPQNPPNPAMSAQPSAAYNPIRNAPLPKTEMTAAAYRTTATGAPQLIHVPANQHQQQYVAYSQIHHPSQSIAPNSAAPPNYAYEYADPAHAQIYYSQPLPPTMPSQYQTMTAAAVAMPEVSAQHPSDSMKQQQIRTSQPL
ncbi:hypothetical protein TanjilG_18342 [Lupinus angustifolius]|uniref:PB1 domain-containing protein n=1 Tax=Lupinus angustifolius TaxID=3871 RepID=A0A1J7HKJ9_LUPAN|nr:hypothetical protein TanjilG_18342 [Lupinus angustifolius]